MKNVSCRRGVVFEMEACGKMVLVCEKKLFLGKKNVCVGTKGAGDRRREYLNKNAWRGLAAIGVAVVLTMGECVSGIQLGIGNGGEWYAHILRGGTVDSRSVTAETAQAARKCR